MTGPRTARWLGWPALLAILAFSTALWERGRNVYFLGQDDVRFIHRSRAVAGGDWSKLLEPQGPHLLPLFTLARMYFDAHFPNRYAGMYQFVLLAHLANTGLLFALSRRYFQTFAAPLFAATLFAWQTIGGEALLIGSQSTYVVSLPWLLIALYLISSADWGRPGITAAGCFLCLLIAVGLHSLAAASAIPGVLLGYFLLGRWKRPSHHQAERLAWLTCGLPVLLACAGWLKWCLPNLDPDHRRYLPEILGHLAARIGDTLKGMVLHFRFLVVGEGQPSKPLLLGALVALLGLLFWLRREEGLRWILTAGALVAGPLALALLLRTSSQFDNSRYAYQTFLPIAVAVGGGVDLALMRAKNRIVVRTCLLILLLLVVPLYYRSQKDNLNRTLAKLETWQTAPSLYREYWVGWQSFFDEAAVASVPVRLPPARLDERWTLAEIADLMPTKGNSNLRMLSVRDTEVQDCVRFWSLAQKTRKSVEPFRRVQLPTSMVILDEHSRLPPGDYVFCQVSSPDQRPQFFPRE